MGSTNPSGVISTVIRGKQVTGSLRSTIVGRAEMLQVRSVICALLLDGAATLTAAGGERQLAAPCVAFSPWPAESRLWLAPGAFGAYLLVPRATLHKCIGVDTGAPELRAMAERRIHLPLAGRPALATAIRAAFDGVLTELAGDAPAAATVMESHLRILLIHLWRAYDVSAGRGQPRSPSTGLFNRFDNLVSQHFREHWQVADYAAALGVSRDRLGDICRRARGRTPKQVIADLMLSEARQLLEGSTHSVQQIAGLLGFPGPSQFSRYFNRATGQPPGRYRATHATRPPEPGDDLHAWP